MGLLGMTKYNKNFYRAQVDGSLSSARRYVGILNDIVKIESVVDLGCGTGSWLKAFEEGGARRLVGIEGEWGNKENLISEKIEFATKNLNSAACSKKNLIALYL